MNNCIFCKIVRGEIPCYKVYEDENTLAFLDIHPLNPGHTLVIPKKHFHWVWDIDNIEEHYRVVKKIALAIKKVQKTDYVISLVFGQEVRHAHTWLVPRFKNDGHGSAIDIKNVKKIDAKEMSNIANKIYKLLLSKARQM